MWKSVEGFLENAPDIIRAAAQSPLGVIALALIVLAVVCLVLFWKAPFKIRLIVFGAVIVVAVFCSGLAVYYQRRPIYPPEASAPQQPKTIAGQSSQPSPLNAKAGDNGTAVVASDRAKVSVTQIITSENRSGRARRQPLPEDKPGSRGARSGQKGVSVDASGSSEVSVRHEQR